MSKMKQYIERMIQEKTDLEGKIRKAKKAVEVPPYGTDKHGLLLLGEQIKLMQSYLEKLNERILYEQEK